MRKIPEKYENPFDNILINIAEMSNNFFHKQNFTANDLTTLSLLFSIWSTFNLYKGKYGLSAILYLVSYYFDCMDGNYARKYKMESKFGDLYDHFSDFIKTIFLFITMYQTNKNKFWKLFPIILFLLFLTFVHMSCQEVYYDKNNSPSLYLVKLLCPANKNNVDKFLKITRYVGVGTFNLFIFYILLTYNK